MSLKRPLEGDKAEAEPKRKKSRKHRPGFDDEIFSETTYYIRNGLRFVKPYYFSFTSHAKGRWVGSRVYDVFCREFQAEKPDYYERAIRAGKVTVNSEIVTMETVLQHNDLLVHRVHRHEPPVTAQPLSVVHQDSNIVAINKPPSIPVHPCGRYRHNSVVFLLGKEHNLKNLHTIHRLDRLTSGLLLFARNLSTAHRLEQQIRDRQVTKEYVCRVHGEFPQEPVVCNEPILVVTHKLGICRVDPAGKTCSTSFTRLSYNGHTSILKCVPKTGRMHQIRVHLQWLGHPIVNDPLYGHPAWGPRCGRGGEGVGNMEQIISEIVESNYNSEATATATSELDKGAIAMRGDEESVLLSMESGCRTQESVMVCVTEQLAETVEEKAGGGEDVSGEVGRGEEGEEVEGRVEGEEGRGVKVERGGEVSGEVGRGEVSGEVGRGEETGEVNHSDHDSDCTECRLVHPDPTPDQLMMYLHALRYTGPDWEYCTDLPCWANIKEHQQPLPQADHNTESSNPTEQ